MNQRVIAAVLSRENETAHLVGVIKSGILGQDDVRAIRRYIRKTRYKHDPAYREQQKAASRRHYARMSYWQRYRKSQRAQRLRWSRGRWGEIDYRGSFNKLFAAGMQERGAVLDLRSYARLAREDFANDQVYRLAGRVDRVKQALNENYTRTGKRKDQSDGD